MHGGNKRRMGAGLGALALLLGMVAGACGVGWDERHCSATLTCGGRLDAAGNPIGGGYCVTECLPKLPGSSLGWIGPALLWLGAPSEDVPACPDTMNGTALESWRLIGGDPPAEASCVKECACAPPACALPSVVETSTSSMCQDGPTETRTPFLPPADWDGACFAPPPVPAERIASIEIGPVAEQPCVPLEDPVPRRRSAGSGWTIEAEVCIGENLLDKQQIGACPRRDAVCMPYVQHTDTSPWKKCILTSGDASCPPGPYTEKMPLLHDGIDDGECERCRCVSTAPSRCEALVTLYEDARCRDFAEASRVADIPACQSTSAEFPLRSLSASWVVNEPGGCAPAGGGTIRSPAFIGTTTLCCLPEPATEDELGPSLDDAAERNERP